jgi:ParB family chromosome partitioning protein
MVRKQLVKMLGIKNELKIIAVPLEDIFRSPYQPRKVFKEEDLRELARSIQNYGVIQPIIVRHLKISSKL